MNDLRRRQERYERLEERVELPMLVVSVIYLPIAIMDFFGDLSPWADSVVRVILLGIYLAFAAELAALLLLSTNRLRTLWTHKLDVLMVIIPALRPLRLAYVLRFARAGTLFARVGTSVGRLLGRSAFGPTLGVVGGFILGGGLLVSLAEHEQPGAQIDGLGDGIWWAFVTCTTVGYGDEFPVTSMGRAIAVFLMLTGISGVSVITANVAAYFVSSDAVDEAEDLAERLARIEVKLDALTAQLASREG